MKCYIVTCVYSVYCDYEEIEFLKVFMSESKALEFKQQVEVEKEKASADSLPKLKHARATGDYSEVSMQTYHDFDYKSTEIEECEIELQ